MEISSFLNLSSGAVGQAAEKASTYGTRGTEEFGGFLDKAMENLNTTNAYLSDAENEKIKWALGETQNTHELSISLQKASTALSYTVAVRDKFMEAYKEIMQIQI